jgi:outer membrane protein assembly factor BamE (lipoprotein component of BamABCDE complex)
MLSDMKHIVLVIALVLLAGCATTFRPWKLSEVEEGMGRVQVVHILGEPDFVEMENGAELLYYSYRENYHPTLANDDHRIHDASRRHQSQQIKQSLKEYRYVVKLVDGNVQSYKELVD